MCTTSFHPPSENLRKILFRFGTRVVCSERICLHARAFLVALENRLGWPGESPQLARRIKLKTYAPSYCGRQNANTTLSLQWPTKFGNIVRVETSRYSTKITTLRRKADPRSLPEVKFLQPSMGVRYDCQQARLLKRNNIFREGGWKLVMHITVQWCLRLG